jgi:hypothetical protein
MQVQSKQLQQHKQSSVRAAPVSLKHVVLQVCSELRVSDAWCTICIQLDLVTDVSSGGWQSPGSLQGDELCSKHSSLRAAAQAAV